VDNHVALSWSAGDTIADILTQIRAVSGLTGYVALSQVDDTTVGFVISGYNTNIGLTVSSGSVTATRTHQGYQTRYYEDDATPYGTQILRNNDALAGSAFTCFDRFYDYYYNSGATSTTGIGGDTLKYSAFNVTDNPTMYNAYNGDYDAYMAAQFEAIRVKFPTTRSGLAAFAIGDECTAKLASVSHTRFDGTTVYDFPNARTASLAGVTVSGFTTGFEPGTGHLGGLAEAHLLYSQVNRSKTDTVNKSIIEGGGTAADYSTTIRLAFQSGSSYAWLFYGGNGNLSDGSARVTAYYARVFRAFKVDSLS